MSEKENKMSVLKQLAQRFPQLYIKPEEGASSTELYQDIVRKGYRYEGNLSHFTGSPDDSFAVENTPVGEVMVLFLACREDFECFYQIMANRCEPAVVPATMGASFIQGFNDWSKIHGHMEEYEAAGGTDPDGEFARFTSKRENFRGALILLSEGPYSAIPASKTPYGEEEWIHISRSIRKYHELTHFVCRRLYPEEKHAIWDEILADCMGLVSAVGYYDTALAKTFFGIENDKYTGGRLEIYTPEEPTEKEVESVLEMIDNLSERCKTLQEQGVGGYELIKQLEKEFVVKNANFM